METRQIEAVYEHGTLKLPVELPLQEGQKVIITIHSTRVRCGGSSAWCRGRATWRSLTAGLTTPMKGNGATVTFHEFWR